ncbi:hypothetical protein SAMN05216167_101558 [Spirosoma endophyticum]|uniref:Uncharacterized protein n=1 Tax=Spirosoma endophyticum TaxID=662367 RepID=A0A1I1GZF8_9BACT|nr:hypothetical protein SAMN05216167_101558 [Spirosoma endophyticum]
MKFKHCLLLSVFLSSLLIGTLLSFSMKAQNKVIAEAHQLHK